MNLEATVLVIHHYEVDEIVLTFIQRPKVVCGVGDAHYMVTHLTLARELKELKKFHSATTFG